METKYRTIELLEEIKQLLSHQKRIMNINDLAKYTGLSKSKIYKLTQLRIIPMSNNPHIRQIFFDKEVIDKWLMGEPNLSDEYLEDQFNKQLFKTKK